ncbi:MAG: hypothetical protein HY390_04515, partial [Deltaproteobacteria bacterium]|nr:hypothetical protein [Deltaproteobacteria bacterium]
MIKIVGYFGVVFVFLISDVSEAGQAKRIFAKDVLMTDSNNQEIDLQSFLNRLPSLKNNIDLSGLTASVLELNKLDGVTATTTELNILAGLTATTSQLNTLGSIQASLSEVVGGGQTALHSHSGGASTLDDAYNNGQSITVDTGAGLTLTNGASQSLVIDSDTTNSTEVNGALDINVGTTTASVNAIEIALTQDDGAAANAENAGIELTLTGNDADGELVGLDIIGAATATATTDTYTAGIRIDNVENSANSMTDGILITSSGVNNGVTDGIDVSADNITNAINIGANNIVTDVATISSDELELLDGVTSLVTSLDTAYNGGQSITVDSGAGLTLTNGASQSLVIDSDTTNSTEVNGALDINVG